MEKGLIVVLSEAGFVPSLVSMLEDADQSPTVVSASSLDELQERAATNPSHQRLIAFCTDIIVPPAVLKLFSRGAYNFHPGPPDYPGLFPSCFAI